MTDLQKISLQILKDVIAICDKHNLNYYAFGGTCLGAVRHKGFIPWDDDIDIAMPRKDYDKFQEIAKKELPENLGLLEPSRTDHYWLEMLKIYDINTTFIESVNINFTDRYCGVGLDIMPLDGVPKGKIRRLIRRWELKNLIQFNFILQCRLRLYGIVGRLQTIFVILSRSFVKFDTYYNIYKKKATKYDFNTSELVAHSGPGVCSPAGIHKYYLDRKCFSEWIMMDFEDIKIKVPKDYDTYLRKYYPGRDYMELPPENEQIIHSTAIIDLEKPYTYYVEKYRKGDLSL